MPNPEDELLADLRTSCTKVQAITKLLGMAARKPVRVTQGRGGNPYEPEDEELEGEEVTILDALADARDSALCDLEDAREEKDQPKIDECKRRVVKYDELMRRAHRYACDLDDELAKESGSKLRVDQQVTKSTGQLHIYLTSLDEWSQGKYAVTLLDALKAGSLDQEATNDLDDARSEKGGLSRTKANSLHMTFALLIECFVEKNSGLQLGTGDAPEVKSVGNRFGTGDAPNVSNLAEHLSKKAKKYGRLLRVSGQGEEAIKGRIEEALKVKAKYGLK
jgi:hypothetical protein